MEGKDWLLVFLAAPLEKEGTIFGVDPIRIMKGMFYFVKDSLRFDVYDFEPYHLGPVSFAIYTDLDNLVEEGHVATEDLPGETWKRYYVTPTGLERAQELEMKADPTLLSALKEHKRFVCSLGFIELLRKVYKDHPEFATESIFKF